MVRPTLLSTRPFLSDRDTLLVTLFAAAIIHLAVIIGVNFVLPAAAPTQARPIDVTLVTVPAKTPPKQASFLAQQHQTGSGSVAVKPSPPVQKVPHRGRGVEEHKRQVDASLLETRPKAVHNVIAQKNAATNRPNPAQGESVTTPPARPISPDTLRQQIAQMGAEVGFGQPESDDSAVKFAHIASAKQYTGAQYLKDWVAKVERTGNLNYPEAALKEGFSNALTLDVGLKFDGSIYSIKIRTSSKSQALDDAAKRIVRLSAPFPPLPVALLKELGLKQQDILVISRVWVFSDQSGLTSR